MSGSNGGNRLAIVIAIIALLLLGGLTFYFLERIDKLTVKPPTEMIEKQLSSWSAELNERKELYDKTKTEIKREMRALPEKSDDWKLKNQLLVQLEQNLLELKTLENEITGYKDSTDLDRIKLRVALTDIQQTNFRESNKLAGDFVVKFNKMGVLQSKIDSLDRLIATYKNRRTTTSSGTTAAISPAQSAQIEKLNKERLGYLNEIARLKSTSLQLERDIDSLVIAINDRDTTVDTLLQTISDMNGEYEKMKISAARNAELATDIDLWYFVKDKTRKPKRRYLVDDGLDYNRGGDIRSIHGIFSISYELFKPFQVANIYLFKTDGEKEKIAEAKMTVRNQQSSEFNLISEKGLSKGDYKVEVQYSGGKIVEQIFHVTN